MARLSNRQGQLSGVFSLATPERAHTKITASGWEFLRGDATRPFGLAAFMPTTAPDQWDPLMQDMLVKPGNEHASKQSQPHLRALLEPVPRACRPCMAGADKDWGSERNLARCEQERLAYLFLGAKFTIISLVNTPSHRRRGGLSPLCPQN